MGSGKQGTAPRAADRTLVSTAAAQPAVRPAPLGLVEATPDKGKDAGEHGRSHSGTMLLTALAVMVAIALRRIGASS